MVINNCPPPGWSSNQGSDPALTPPGDWRRGTGGEGSEEGGRDRKSRTAGCTNPGPIKYMYRQVEDSVHCF